MVTVMFSHSKLVSKKNSLLRLRNEHMKSIFNGSDRVKDHGQGLFSINCADNPNHVIQKSMPEELFSYVRRTICSQCGDEYVINRCFVGINIYQLENETISNLNTCLLDALVSERPNTECRCGGTKELTLKFSKLIMIDLQMELRIKEASLNEIPKNLNILGERFALYACIEYIGSFDTNGIGHYVSHIYRPNNRWERYDDTKSSIRSSNPNQTILPQVLFYVQEQ